MNGDLSVEFHSFSYWHCSLHLKRDLLLEFCVAIVYEDRDNHTSRVSCQKGPTRHAYAGQIGPIWQYTLDM